MPRKKKSTVSNQQLSLDFETIINSSEERSRDYVFAETEKGTKSSDYDPISQTADYARKSLRFEESWETTIQEAREQLSRINPRELYLDFFKDLKRQIEQNSPKAPRLAQLLEHVGIRGLGMTYQHMNIRKPVKGGTRWKITPFDVHAIQIHLENHIIGEYFLNPISLDPKIVNF